MVREKNNFSFKGQRHSTDDKEVFVWVCPRLLHRSPVPSNSPSNCLRSLQGVSHMHPETILATMLVSLCHLPWDDIPCQRGIPPHMALKDPHTTACGFPPAPQPRDRRSHKATIPYLCPNWPSIDFSFCNYCGGHCYFPEPVVTCFSLFLPLIERKDRKINRA